MQAKANPLDSFLIGYVWGRKESGQAVDLEDLVQQCPMRSPAERSALECAFHQDKAQLAAWIEYQRERAPEFGDSVFESIVRDRAYRKQVSRAIALIQTLPDMNRLCGAEEALSQAEEALKVIQSLKRTGGQDGR